MLAALFAPLLLALPVVQGPSPEDLTEAGDVLRFSPAPWGLEIRIAGDPWLDRPAFSLKGRPGRRLLCRLPDLPPDWSVRAWVGPGRWRPLSAAPAPGGGIEFHVLFRRSREVIELIPPQPAGAPRAGSYSWSRFQAWIQSLPPDPRLSITTLGASVEGRSVYRLLFDDPQSKAPPAWKRTFLVLVRQHGDEWASSYVLEGMVDLLLGRGTTTPPLGLTRYTRWVIYPLVNPDGAFHDQRWNANGVDLNRDWSPTGPWAGQQPETWLLQSDIAGLPWLPAIRAGGDHHGWSRGTDGGYRHGLLMPPALVAEPAWREAVQDTILYTAWEPLVWDWHENGGVNGMARVELYHWLDVVVHTPEYDLGIRNETTLRRIGEQYLLAMYDALHGVTLTDAGGAPRSSYRLGEAAWPEVDDLDENRDPGRVETVQVTLEDWRSGDVESLTLRETAADTGLFRPLAGLPTAPGPPAPGDGVLQTGPGSWIVARYTDADRPLDDSRAGARVRP